MDNKFYGLWYKQPPCEWVDALPIGNGRFGGMVYGGVRQETISLNEETVWDGAQVDRNNPDALQKLGEIREAIFNGQYAKAEQIGGGMLGVPKTLDSYQPLCSFDASFSNAGDACDYKRGLDIEKAVHFVEYRLESGPLYRREAFASSPDNMIVMRWHTDDKNGMQVNITLSRQSQVEVSAAGWELLLTGRCREGGVGFAALLSASVDKGEIHSGDSMLTISGAATIELRIAGFTDFRGGDAEKMCREVLAAASGMNYDQLRQRHIDDYRSLYARQRFSLGGDPRSLPTDELIKAYKAGNRDMGAALYELWYNYLRYQLICSSRPGTMPSTLQGIWNDKMKAPWNSDFHPNVNMQINYWPSEGYGLPECVAPLINWLCAIVPDGEKTAKTHYGARGWVLHHISDIFNCTTPMDGPWGIWPFGGAWLCRHLYERYLYGGDAAYLKDVALPVIEGAALFMLDFLIECPKGIDGEGYLVTCPSHSPENRFITADGQVSWLTYAAAMDMEIIYDLFTIYIDCLDISGEEGAYRAEVEAARGRLAPLKVSSKTGCLMEWISDYDEQDPGHRHVSHLYALYPGTQITEHDKELMRASDNALERRFSNNYKAQGWSCGWVASLFARLRKGDRSLDMLDKIACDLTFDNLFVNAHGNPQVGDAQGVAACIQEMLVQSHDGVIDLLPALPSEWENGAMEGLRVRGGHVVDLHWAGGQLVKARLKPTASGEIAVRAPLGLGKVLGPSGAQMAVGQDPAGCISFSVEAGATYTLL
ncbi:MAG: glycoside hydrolase family 95 protein [Oscillospiraceae bacterium]|nr:glycoside hydrolase family 95 protein [Oscillospiraceae bacterium]